MKIAKRLLTFILALSTLFAVGCSVGGGDTDAKHTMKEPDPHYYEGGLHDVNVKENKNRIFVKSGKSDYVIVTNASDKYALEGAIYIRDQVREATGATLEVLFDDGSMSYSASSKQIIVADNNLFQKAGLVMPQVDLKRSGYYLKTVNNNVFIASQDRFGIQQGVLSFLRQTLGFDQFRDGYIIYSKDGSTIPDMTIIERPDYELMQHGGKTTQLQRYGMGFIASPFGSYKGQPWHNSMYYLPKEEYYAAHEEWYSTEGDEVCYTAHGDPEQFDLMTRELARLIFELAIEDSYSLYFAFTMMDSITRRCKCDACEEIMDNYNACYSAAVIKFMNVVNEHFQKNLQDYADANNTKKREAYLTFFAYHYLETPPVVEDGKGGYKPIDDSVICDDEVAVFFAPINAMYNQDFYHEDNIPVDTTLSGWGCLTKKIVFWSYTTNFKTFMYPLNSFDSLIGMFRHAKIRGADHSINQSQYINPNTTGFDVIKSYIGSKALFNVNLEYDDIVNDFFDGYFQVAKKPMRQMYDELIAHMRYLEETYLEVSGYIYFDIDNEKYWPYQKLVHWLDLIEEAFKLIEPLKLRQPELYKKLRINILAEKLFPEFALLTLHEGMISDAELRQRRIQFKQDCKEVDLIYYAENKTMDDAIFKEWGV